MANEESSQSLSEESRSDRFPNRKRKAQADLETPSFEKSRRRDVEAAEPGKKEPTKKTPARQAKKSPTEKAKKSQTEKAKKPQTEKAKNSQTEKAKKSTAKESSDNKGLCVTP